MKKGIFKIGVIITLVLTLVMTNFIWVGYQVVIAMYEELESQDTKTNVTNVEFDAYFLSDGSKVHSKQSNISQEENLILNINVKDSGVLNDAKVKIENSNFVVLKDKVNSEYVKNIDLDKNEIELNQIINQNNIEIILPISFNKKENFEEDYFEKENTIYLTGVYEDEKQEEVQGNVKTRINWTEDVDLNLVQDVEKYINLGENGVLLEENIITEVIDNKLPREYETLEVEIPEIESTLPQKVTILCNGDKLGEDKVQTDLANKKLTINNETRGVWKNAINQYKIIYVYSKEIGSQEREIKLKTTANIKLYTKDIIEKQEEKTVQISEKGNVASISKTATENLEKGYLYVGGENNTLYNETNKIEVSNKEVIEKIEINNIGEAFLNNQEETFDIINKVNYKQIMINKQNMINILGEDGVITVYNENGEILSVINNTVEADENGNIIVNYENKEKNIKIVTTKPQNEGTLLINAIKEIEGNAGYEKEELKEFIGLITKTGVITNLTEEIGETKVNLIDTKTEATISLNNNNLSTLQTNENVQFLITLNSNSAKYDLYKNPKISIILPKELNINVKNITQLNGQDELNIINPKLMTNENGEQIIELELQGEQTKFVEESTQGIQIVIIGDIVISKEVPTKDSEIRLEYTNENRKGETFTNNIPIKINSKPGVLLVNKLSNYDSTGNVIEVIDDKEKTVTIEANAQQKIVTGKTTVINNYDIDITDLVIIGRIANEDKAQSIFGLDLSERINVEGTTGKVYYSEDINADKISTTWVENPTDLSKVRAFKIVLDENKLSPEQVINVGYQLKLPEGLQNDVNTYIKTEIDYNYVGNEEKTEYMLNLSTPKITQGSEEEVDLIKETGNKQEDMEIQVYAKADGKSLTADQEVYEGEAISYKISVTNNTNEVMKNVLLKAEYINAILYGHVKEQLQNRSR